MTYDGRPLWEELFEPRFNSQTNRTESIFPHRFIFIGNDYKASHNPSRGFVNFGIALESDGITGRSQATHFEEYLYTGSGLAFAARLAGTKRLEMASVGRRGDWVKSDSTGRGIVTTNPAEALAQLKEDAAIGSRSLVMFNICGFGASSTAGTGGNTGGGTGGDTGGGTGGGTGGNTYGQSFTDGSTDNSRIKYYGFFPSTSFN